MVITEEGIQITTRIAGTVLEGARGIALILHLGRHSTHMHKVITPHLAAPVPLIPVAVWTPTAEALANTQVLQGIQTHNMEGMGEVLAIPHSPTEDMEAMERRVIIPVRLRTSIMGLLKVDTNVGVRCFSLLSILCFSFFSAYFIS